jgi:hypothetical protein
LNFSNDNKLAALASLKLHYYTLVTAVANVHGIVHVVSPVAGY